MHTPVLKSLFFQSSNGLTSTPAALPEDRQALELHLVLARAALSRNDRTHAEAGQLPRQGQPSRLRPELSQCRQGGIPLRADSAASVEPGQPLSSAGAAGNSQMSC